MTQLYDRFQPKHYQIYLNINRKAKRFGGRTVITGHARDRQILINQKGLHIRSITSANHSIPFTNRPDKEAIQLTLPRTGATKFTIEYSAPLTDSLMGIYPSYYVDHGVRKQIIGTQFESTFARQAFPCVDEPEAKATFSLAIKYDEHPGETIISNMPEDHVKNGVHYFQQTLRMSTYLVAFAFGDLIYQKTRTDDGVEVGVFAAASHHKSELGFALHIAKRAIEFYEKYYQTKYPLPHSWQLALPDFSAGAMENWGLVTYRESLLLLDPRNASFSQKQLVAKVIAHELAHQWFGDLVTMKWWNDLWLNESFANMMEYVAVDALEPHWHIWENFQNAEVPTALQRDAIDGVQPIHIRVNSPGAINSLFDPAIVYAKGARMLVMVRALLGDTVLRRGLKLYLHIHQYGNAQGDDLWRALGKVSGTDVKAIMDSWLDQPGYPVVAAVVKNGQLLLTQKQFFIGNGHDHQRRWQIPLNSNYSSVPQLMKSDSLKLGNYQQLRQQVGKPFRLNVGDQSHFIVKYDPLLLKDIVRNLDSLDDVTRLQLLQDSHLLAKGGEIAYAKLVNLLPKFVGSHSAIVNAKLNRIVGQLKMFVSTSHERQSLQYLEKRLSQRSVHRLGVRPRSTDTHDDELTRPLVLKTALDAKSPQAVRAAHQLYSEYHNHPGQLPASVRGLVMANEVQNYGHPELFRMLMNVYHQSQDANYKNDIVTALTSTEDPKLIKRLLQQFENSKIIRPQDLRSWFYHLLANRRGESMAWNWLCNHWPWLEKTVGGDMEFTFYVTAIAKVFHTTQQLNEFKQFFAPKTKIAGLTREIKMDTRIIANRVNVIRKNRQTVNQAISQLA